MKFWKTIDENRIIQRIETLDKVECDQCGRIITKDAEDDVYIRTTSRIYDDYGEQILARSRDLCRKCAIELVTREFLSHKNPNMGFSVDIRHLRTRNERTVEEIVDGEIPYAPFFDKKIYNIKMDEA